MSPVTFSDFLNLLWATAETGYMVLMSTALTVLLGLPLGTLLFTSTKLKQHRGLQRCISVLINSVRSIPFIILLVLLIPLTRFLVGTSIGVNAAIVPLALGATPFFARLVDNVYRSIPEGLIDAGSEMGANTWQMIRFILFPEALPALVQSVTVTAITLVNYSAMAGAVGGGGLGDFAIRYGYQRFNTGMMLATVAILILLVQAIQMIGDHWVQRRLQKQGQGACIEHKSS